MKSLFLPLKNYSINSTKLEMILRFFYAFLAYLTGMQFSNQILYSDVEHLKLNWPLLWLHHVPIRESLIILMLISIFFHLASSLYVYNRPFKFISCALFFLMAALDASITHFGFANLSCIYCGFCLAFIKSNEIKEAEKDNRFYFLSTQLIFLILYSLSGFWKIRGFLDSIKNPQWWTIDPYTVSYQFNKLQSFDFHLENSLFPTWLGYVVWTGIVLVEIVSASLVFFPGLQRFWGILLFAFHTGTGLILKIFFGPHAILLSLLLISHPYESRKQPSPHLNSV